MYVWWDSIVLDILICNRDLGRNVYSDTLMEKHTSGLALATTITLLANDIGAVHTSSLGQTSGTHCRALGVSFKYSIFHMQNYYNHHLYGGQQYSPYMGPPSSSGSSRMFHGYYLLYPQYNPAQSNNQAQVQTQHQYHQGFSFQYSTPTPLLQYPNLPHQHFNSHQSPPPPILSLPTSLALSLASSSLSSSSSTSTSVATKAAAEASINDGHEAIIIIHQDRGLIQYYNSRARLQHVLETFIHIVFRNLGS